MTDKQLKKLKRGELLEILVAQNKENDALKEEIASLKEKLEARELLISQAGSIAEAAMELNEIFVRAQKAADLYVENVQRLADTGSLNADEKQTVGSGKAADAARIRTDDPAAGAKTAEGQA